MGSLHKARPCESSEAAVVLRGCPELLVVVEGAAHPCTKQVFGVVCPGKWHDHGHAKVILNRAGGR